MRFEARVSCVNNPSRGVAREDHFYEAEVDHAALDGNPDDNLKNDNCSNSTCSTLYLDLGRDRRQKSGLVSHRPDGSPRRGSRMLRDFPDLLATRRKPRPCHETVRQPETCGSGRPCHPARPR